jgi:hypothetical protein
MRSAYRASSLSLGPLRTRLAIAKASVCWGTPAIAKSGTGAVTATPLRTWTDYPSQEPADKRSPDGFITPEKPLWLALLDGVPLPAQCAVLRQRQNFMAGFFTPYGAIANENIDPPSLIPDHLGDHHALADIHGAAPVAPGLLPYALAPANDVRLDKPAAARNPFPRHAYPPPFQGSPGRRSSEALSLSVESLMAAHTRCPCGRRAA